MSNIILMAVGFLLFLLSVVIYFFRLYDKASDGDEKSIQMAIRTFYMSFIASIFFIIGLFNSAPILSEYSFEQGQIIFGISFFSVLAIAIFGGAAFMSLSQIKISMYKKLLYGVAFVIIFLGSVAFSNTTYKEYNKTEYTFSEIVSAEYSVDETNGPTYKIETADGNTYNTAEENIIVTDTSEAISYMEVESFLHSNNDGSKRIAKITAYLAE